MAARSTRKKTTARKATRKKASRKKTTRKKAARKKTTRKPAARKKASRKRATPARKKATPARKKSAASRRNAARKTKSALVSQLPQSLAEFRRTVERELRGLERLIVAANKENRVRLTRLLRDASRHLGRVESQGSAQWRKLAKGARSDAEQLLRRLRKATGR